MRTGFVKPQLNTRAMASAPRPSSPKEQREKARTQALRAGFTLLEVMVSIALLGLVVGAIYSSWTAILKASKVGEDYAASVQRARIAVRTIEDSLSTAHLFTQAQKYYTFLAENGSQASLSFVARLSKSFPRSGKFGDLDVRRVTYSLEPSTDSSRLQSLVLRQQSLLAGMDVDEQEHPLILARNVKEFGLEFWDERHGEWIDEWLLTNQLPKMVKITIGLSDDPYGHTVTREVTRVVSIPSIAVTPNWQTPIVQGPGGVNPGQPPTPGGLPQNPNQPGTPFQQLPVVNPIKPQQ